MKREMILAHVYAIAYWASRENIGKHLNIVTGNNYAQMSFFFDLDSPETLIIKGQISKATMYDPSLNIKKFYDDGFETLEIEWSLPDEF